MLAGLRRSSCQQGVKGLLKVLSRGKDGSSWHHCILGRDNEERERPPIRASGERPIPKSFVPLCYQLTRKRRSVPLSSLTLFFSELTREPSVAFVACESFRFALPTTPRVSPVMGGCAPRS